MIHTLKCPSCAAPLDYEDDHDRPSVRCPFCNNLVVVPDDLRRKDGPQVVVTSYSTGGRHVKLNPVVGYVIVGGVLLFVGGILFGVIRTINSVADGVSRSMQPPPRPQPPNIVIPPIPPGLLGDPKATPTPGPPAYANVLLKFGSEGIGPGSFTDARSIALDGEGRIYVGEYTGGRIQVFDAEGKFITQWFADRTMPLRGLAADRRGAVYVVQRGKIQKFEGMTGRPLGEVSYQRNSGFDDVVATPDGGLVAAWDHHTDDIIRFDSSLRPVKVVSKAMSGQTDRSELNLRVAADGAGNLYGLGTFNDSVVKYTPEGRFVNRFGGSGGEPGQIRAASAIAVDNKGRVYVSDIKGVQVFDPNGRYLDVFKPDGPAFGMVFNDRNELFIAARTHVIKFALTNP
jgi:DNA-binding beta-propeller fold protein YncE